MRAIVEVHGEVEVEVVTIPDGVVAGVMILDGAVRAVSIPDGVVGRQAATTTLLQDGALRAPAMAGLHRLPTTRLGERIAKTPGHPNLTIRVETIGVAAATIIGEEAVIIRMVNNTMAAVMG